MIDQLGINAVCDLLHGDEPSVERGEAYPRRSRQGGRDEVGRDDVVPKEMRGGFEIIKVRSLETKFIRAYGWEPIFVQLCVHNVLHLVLDTVCKRRPPIVEHVLCGIFGR